MNSGPSSWDMKREDRRDSLSTGSKFGDVRYVTDMASVPIGWVTGPNSWKSVGSDTRLCTGVSREQWLSGSSNRDKGHHNVAYQTLICYP